MHEITGQRVWVAGHRGMVGSAVARALAARGDVEVIGWTRSELDLRDRSATSDAALEARPDVVVLSAARVGGILANTREPVEFLADNLRIQTNVLEAAHRAGVPRLLFLASSCIYPRDAAQPMVPELLFTGPLEPTNEAYAVAKIAGIALVQAYRRQHGVAWISCLPTNVYGPGDNFDPESSHVLPALIRRLHSAVRARSESVTIWGSGTPRRELLHVDDLASACLRLLESYDSATPINVGTGEDLTIAEIVSVVAAVVGYRGSIVWDKGKPDGMPRKLLDVTPMKALGWEPRVDLVDGVRAAWEWYCEHGE